MALILVVDDSMYQRRIIRKNLIALEHEVIEAGTGKVGLELIASANPDVVMLDLIMPVVGGLEVLSELQKQGVEIPILVNTADIQASTYEQCMTLGAFAVLNKPISSNELREYIGKALASKSVDSP